MQDRYAGDVGDFSKYALLRALVKTTGWSCGLIWYRYPCEDHNADGKHINYFDNRQFNDCDQELVRCLQGVSAGQRSISALQESNLLPSQTRYFDETLAWDQNRAANRKLWFERAQETVKGCDLVMVDPDNGLIDPVRFRPGRVSAGKYVQLSEIKELAEQSRCVVIYQHFGRNASHESQIGHWQDSLRQHIGGQTFALRYQRYSPRAYFVVSTDAVAATRALEVARELTQGRWKAHFQLYGVNL